MIGERIGCEFCDPFVGAFPLGEGHVGDKEGRDILNSPSPSFNELPEIGTTYVWLEREGGIHHLLDLFSICERKVKPFRMDFLDNCGSTLGVRLKQRQNGAA